MCATTSRGARWFCVAAFGVSPSEATTGADLGVSSKEILESVSKLAEVEKGFVTRAIRHE